MSKVTERIPFRLLHMHCCGTQLCHVNHRWPTFCSQCGERVYPQVRGWALFSDDNASLTYNIPVDASLR
jgi:NADH pyrophosphatase NudC (nudix superfamily)